MAARKEEQIKQKYLEYQLLVQQIKQLQETITTLEKHVFDMNALNDDLIDISKVNVGEEILMPVGSGLFLRGKLNDNKAVIMNVGVGVCVEKSLDEAAKTISQQIEETSKLLEQMQNEFAKIFSGIHELQEELKMLRAKDLDDK